MPFVRYAPKTDTYWRRETRGGDVRKVSASSLGTALAKRARDAQPEFIEIPDKKETKGLDPNFIEGMFGR